MPLLGMSCLNCGAFGMRYTSDRSGNVRRYVCYKCDAKFLATIKGLRSGSAVGEPRHLEPEDFHWVKILE